MRAFVPVCLVATLLAVTTGVARPGDAPATAAERGQAVLDAMPAPGAKDSLKIELHILMGGSKLGEGTLQTSVDTIDPAVWHFEESLALAMGDVKKISMKSSGNLAADLHLLRLDAADTEDGVSTTTSAVRTATGFAVVKTGADGKKESAVEADVHTLGSMLSVLLFMRNCPAEPASYELHSFSEKKAVIEKGVLDVKGPGKFTEGATSVDAWVVHSSFGEHVADFYFDPTDRSFIALRGAEGVLMVKAGLLNAVAKELDVTKPASSAPDAGSRMALAILTSDSELLAGVLHWPTLLADAKATGYTGEADAFKAATMDQFKQSYKTLDRAQASSIVMGAASGAKEEIVGDVTVVTFGAPMNKLVYTAKAIDGVWYIVKLVAVIGTLRVVSA